MLCVAQILLLPTKLSLPAVRIAQQMLTVADRKQEGGTEEAFCRVMVAR